MMTLRFVALIVLILVFSTSPNSALADACTHAPLPRLRVGEPAVVADGIYRLNLRALPAVDTGIQRLIHMGMTLTVVSGPSCNGTYNWWRVETASGERGWVAEGDWESYFIVPASDGGRVVDPYDWSCGRWPSSRLCLVP